MASSSQGIPCWYELGTSDLDAAQGFYARVLNWQIAGAGMPGFDYRLAEAGGDKVAGMMSLDHQEGSPPPNWLIYFSVDDADRTEAAVRAAGGQVLKTSADIPGTGRFAVLADPQGAAFGILQPLPMPDGSTGHAFDQAQVGHGNWHELMTTDPNAALDFYGRLFGWKKSKDFDMGEMGLYQLFSHQGADIGGMMGLGQAPSPCWLPYFGVDGASAAIERIQDGGGKVGGGPTEVPGPAFIAVATDPQGAYFAVVGPQK